MVIKIYLDASVIVPAMLSSVGGSAKLIKFIKLGLVVGITSQNNFSKRIAERFSY